MKSRPAQQRSERLLPALPATALRDLAKSGIDRNDAALMRISHVDIKHPRWSSLNRIFNGLECPLYTIPYFDVRGKETTFARFKVLGTYVTEGDKKPRKYLQLPNTPPKLYWPPNVVWREVLRDTSTPIYFVEGEKKAFTLAKLGYAAIGLGGVNSYSSGGVPLPELNLISGRNVIIIFDSDERTNPNIKAAKKSFVKQLINLGHNPSTIELPLLKNQEKTGVDDFIVHHAGKGRNWKKARLAFERLPIHPLFVPPTLNTTRLSEMKLPETKWLVPGLIPKGLILLCGAPKIGKSFLLLQLQLTVANGGKFLSTWPTAKAASLYISLEDTQKRFQGRVKSMASAGLSHSKNAELTVRWPSHDDNALKALDKYLSDNPQCQLVLIDTLAKFRPPPTGKSNTYADDYEHIAALKKIADERDVAIVIAHHTRKAGDDDPFNTVSGTTGITGAADAIVVLRRSKTASEGQLLITGRDVETQDHALKWDNGVWSYLGKSEEHLATEQRKQILDFLAAQNEPVTPKFIADSLQKKAPAVSNMLGRLCEAGRVIWSPGGKYTLKKKE